MEIDYDNSVQMISLFVDNGVLPRFIYKYTSFERFLQILDSGKIKFSNPSQFNDPFDCNLTIDTNNTDEEIIDYVESLAKTRGLNNQQKETILKKYLNRQELFQLTNDSVKKVKERFGITCFSSKNDSLLMWAHYADSHKGVCLKFDLLNDPDFFMTPFPVHYDDKYPVFNYIRQKDWIAKFLLESKSKEWEYESEIRIMKESSGLYDFNKDCLTELIFGCKCDLNNINLAKSKCESQGFQKTTFKVAKIKQWEYKLDIE